MGRLSCPIFAGVVSLAILLTAILEKAAFSNEIPEAGTFEIRTISDKPIIYVMHDERAGHISNSLITLVQYYLLNENLSFRVVFPQFSVEIRERDGIMCAVGITGQAVETEKVKQRVLKGGVFGCYVFKGSYNSMAKGVKQVFEHIGRLGGYRPDECEEIRFLYWNSIDDHQPEELITEIQVRVKKWP